ncbi:MAG: hypothetical protein Q9218_004434 [Villophora microphyllina]
MAPAAGSVNATPAAISALLPKFGDADADIRYMSLNDLDKILRSGSQGFLSNEYPTCAKVVENLLKTLDDTNGEVQNQAIKCIGSLTQKAPADLLAPLIDRLSTMKTTNSVDNSIPATALRTFLTAFPRPVVGVQPPRSTQDAYSAISRVLIPRLVGYVVIAHGISTKISPPPAMLEVQQDNSVDHDALDVLIDLIRCFGPMLQDAEKKALQKSTMAIFNHERTSTIAKKKAVSAISLLTLYMSDTLLSSFVSNTLENFSKPNLTPSQHRLLMTMLASLARTVPQRFGSYIKNLAPFLLDTLSEKEYRVALNESAENGTVDTEAEEVREASLLALEAFLLSCSNDMRPYTDESIEAALRFVAYDPNVAPDEDDEAMGGTQDDADDEDKENSDEGEEEDFEEEGAMSDDDDASWKIRRCAAKALHAIISTRSNGDLLDNGVLYHKIAPTLVARFQEREENVRLEVLSTMTTLVHKTSDSTKTLFSFAGEPEFELASVTEARSRKRRRLDSDATLFESPISSMPILGFQSPETSPPPSSGPRADLARLSSTILRGVSKLLKESTPATKQGSIALLREIVIIQRGGLSEHFRLIAGPLTEAVRLSAGGSHSQSVGTAASASSGKLRIEALQLVCAVCDNHSSTIITPHVPGLVSAVVEAAQDKYVKVSSAAIVAVESLLKVLTPPRSASAEQNNRKFVEQLYDIVLDRAVATDADVEVRQRAIHALGVLLARDCGHSKASVLNKTQSKKATEVLLDRLRNETTRLSAVRAVNIFLNSLQDTGRTQAQWMRDVAIELGAQLRKANRSLRGACLAALRDLAGNPAALSHLDDTAIHALVGMLLPLVSANDLNLLGMTLVIFSKLVQHNPSQIADQSLTAALCGIAIAPLAGAVLDALLLLLKGIGDQGIGRPLMQSLLQDVGVNGDAAIVGKCIGTLLVAGEPTVGVKLNDFVHELQSAPDDKRKCLALSVLGEAGLRLQSKSPLEPSLFTTYFSSKSQSLPRAAATALGRAGAGNIKTYLPVILSSTSRSGSSQYLSLHAIKEILQFSSHSKADLSSYTKQIWDTLLAASQAEDNKAVGAECIGRLAIIEPRTFLPLLKKYLQDRTPSVRGMVIQAIRFTLSDSDETFDEVLKPMLISLLTFMLNDADLENRRLALGALNSATHNKSDIIFPNLTDLVPLVMNESKIKPGLVREVQMGPFKHKVDDGLEVRKSAYETLYTLMEGAYSRINTVDLFDRIVDGLDDEHEIKILCNLMLTKLVVLDPDETGRHVDVIVERYRSILTFKLKDTAVKQEIEKLNEANKGVLKVTLLLHDTLPANTSSGSNFQSEKWKGYWDWVAKEFRGQLASVEQEMKSNKRRSLSTQGGGILNRMFGSSSSPTKETHSSPSAEHALSKPHDGPGSIPDGLNLKAADDMDSPGESRNSIGGSSTGRKSLDDGSSMTEKKRRSSSVAKASALFSSAKNSLHLHGTTNSPSNPDSPLTPQPTAIQKLGKTDPVLSVPQGSLNNSAGESRPGPRSTFRVGVTEDKNKKCRRTMEDTHAYLYNFLSTPAPNVGSDIEPPSTARRREDIDSKQSSSMSASHVVETDNGYFAIFDGHAGTFAADWCGKKLHVLLEDMIRKHPNTPVPELLDSTFTSVDQQLETLPLKNSGCTAICAVLRWEDRVPNSQSATGSTAIAPAAAAAVRAVNAENSNNTPEPSQNLTPEAKAVVSSSSSATTAIPKLQETASRQRVLYTANVGDARIVLCRNGKALRLSYDHKGSDENEGKRISNAGGLILNNRVNGVLAVTRALGDSYMKDLVTGHPYTTETVIQPDIDEFLILACDGLWDVCSDQEAVDLVRHTQDPQLASKQLVDHALARFSTDNLSCMLVRFDGKALQQTVERKAEPIGVEGDPPTKHGGISEADAIIKEARHSMGSSGTAEEVEETKRRVSQDIIREEAESEPGPEMDPQGAKHLQAAKQK